MKRHLLFVVGLVLLSVSVNIAQNNELPNFSGTWVRTFEKKDKKTARERVSDYLVIKHTEPVFQATERREIESLDDKGNVVGKDLLPGSTVIYYTDGRGETNRLISGETSQTITKLKGRSLQVGSADKKNQSIFVRTFALSKDGKEISVGGFGYQMTYDTVTRRDTPVPAALMLKKVYKKVD